MQMIFLSLVLTAFTIYFSAQNTLGVTIRFGGKTLAIFPLYAIVIFSLLLGFLIAYLFSLGYRIASEKEKRQEKQVLLQEEKQVAKLLARIHDLEERIADMTVQLRAYERHLPQKISTPIEVKEVNQPQTPSDPSPRQSGRFPFTKKE